MSRDYYYKDYEFDSESMTPLHPEEQIFYLILYKSSQQMNLTAQGKVDRFFKNTPISFASADETYYENEYAIYEACMDSILKGYFFTELKDNEYYLRYFNRFIAGIDDYSDTSKYSHLSKQERRYFQPYKKEIGSLHILDFFHRDGGEAKETSKKTSAQIIADWTHNNSSMLDNERYGNGYTPSFEEFKTLFCIKDYERKVYDIFNSKTDKEYHNVLARKNFYFDQEQDKYLHTDATIEYRSYYNKDFKFIFNGREDRFTGKIEITRDTISKEAKELEKRNEMIVSNFCMDIGFPFKPTAEEYSRFLKSNNNYMLFKIKTGEKYKCFIWKALKILFPDTRIDRETFKAHTYIVGQSGSGKSELLKTVISAIAGRVILIDPHGDLATSLQRKDGVITIAPHERRFCINPFDIYDKSLENRELAAQEIQNLMSEMMADSNLSALMETISFPIISTLLKLPYADFAMFADCIQPTQEGREKLEALAEHIDPHHRRIWASLCNDTYETTKRSIFNRLQSFLNKKLILDSTSGKDDLETILRHIEKTGENIVISLPIPAIGEQVSEVLGRFFMTKLQIFARRREAIPEKDRIPLFLIVDEVQNFLSKETARTLDQFGRKFKLYMTLANQHIRQIEDTQLKGSILSNCKNKIVGMSDKATRQALAGEMGLNQEIFEGLKAGHFWGKFDTEKPLKFYAQLIKSGNENIRYVKSRNSGEWVDGWEKAGMKKTIMGNTETGKTDKIKPKYDL